MITETDNSVRLTVSEPVTVIQGNPEENLNGMYQFPLIAFTAEGDILAHWAYCMDAIDWRSHGDAPTDAVSRDGGAAWQPVDPVKEKIVAGTLLPNGKRFLGFVRKPAYPLDNFDHMPARRITPKGNGLYAGELYFAKDLADVEDAKVYAEEYDPATGEITRFETPVDWPFMPVKRYSTETLKNHFYPATTLFGLENKNNNPLVIGNSLYFATYTEGFNSDAGTVEEAFSTIPEKFNVYVFRSDDYGHSWKYVSQILFENVPVRRCSEGFDEPGMTLMPDGSVVMLMRTGGGVPDGSEPCYFTRSTDNCQTWSAPAVFDDIGVFPRLLTLGCGVTLATYGRPGIRIRASADSKGLAWDKPITLEDGISSSSCYTDMIALDDHTALLIYDRYCLPNEEGKPTRGVLVRKITAETT